MDKKIDNSLIGAAGEHFVLSQLLMKGFTAGLAPVGARTIDLLIYSREDQIKKCIQVKSSRNRSSWPMNVKHETIKDPDIFYVFVNFTKEFPISFVIPSKKVAEVIKESHSTWLNTPGKKGQKHNDTKMRQLSQSFAPMILKTAPENWMEKYRENWDLLN